jgi:hypothetical protein
VRTATVAAGILFLPQLLIAQQVSDDLCTDPVPMVGDRLAYYDKLGNLFGRLDSVYSVAVEGNQTSLDAALRLRLDTLRRDIDSTFTLIERSRASRYSEFDLWTAIGKYEAFIALGFEGTATPPSVRERLCPIRAAYALQVLEELKEHGRKMEVRYGSKSERLNIFEMLLDQWTTPPLATGKLRDPLPWEWILRSQTLGYQYNRGTRELEPSFPILELGVTRYLFGTGAVSRRIHHLGLAGAYQRDVKRARNLFGFVLHLQEFDVGALCSNSCREHVIVGSKNLSFFGSAWTDMRKALNR